MNNARIYGLKNCDTCRKAKKVLEASGLEIDFIDVRNEPLDKAFLTKLLDQFGAEKLVNQRSTTWRGLSEAERTQSPLDLLLANPSLMKRPVIEKDGTYHLGWTDKTRTDLL